MILPQKHFGWNTPSTLTTSTYVPFNGGGPGSVGGGELVQPDGFDLMDSPFDNRYTSSIIRRRQLLPRLSLSLSSHPMIAFKKLHVFDIEDV